LAHRRLVVGEEPRPSLVCSRDGVARRSALVNQHIGLEETDDGVWAIYFNTVLLATLDERDFLIRG